MGKMKRQGMIVTLNELHNLIGELKEQFDRKLPIDYNRKFQINIINKTPEQSDTWEIESPKP